MEEEVVEERNGNELSLGKVALTRRSCVFGRSYELVGKGTSSFVGCLLGRRSSDPNLSPPP